MAKSHRTCRLKIQGRLLLLCLGSALPVATVLAISSYLQFCLLQGKSAHITKQALSSLLTQTTLLAILAALASAYLVFLATWHFSRQIRLLVKEVLALGRGDLSKRVKVTSNDELGKLAKAFNQIAAKLQISHEHKETEEKISLAIRQSLDLDQVLMTTVSELGKALGASRCCLALIDNTSPNGDHRTRPADQELIFDYIWFDGDKGGTALDNRSLHITEYSIMSMIIEQGSILSLDVLDDDKKDMLL